MLLRAFAIKLRIWLRICFALGSFNKLALLLNHGVLFEVVVLALAFRTLSLPRGRSCQTIFSYPPWGRILLGGKPVGISPEGAVIIETYLT